MDEDRFLIAFATIPGLGPARLKLLVNYFGSAGVAWGASGEDLAKVGLPKDVLAELLAQKAKLNIDQYIADLNKREIKYLTIRSSLYPPRLKNISDPPNVLFYRASLPADDHEDYLAQLVAGKAIAVVGTRKMTAYGREVTEKLTAGLVGAGFTIVSGMALGVDGVAAGTAINSGGKTVAVLGAGVDIIYPPEHRSLYNSILEHQGVIVSEVAPEKRVGRGIFPARNRIISGLSEAVLVTEGAIDSGSLITARLALEQGREVFAVPGPISSPVCEGTNYLLKQGAKLVTGVEDILQELGYEIEETKDNRYETKDKKRVAGGTPEEQTVIDLLFNEPMEFDELVKRSGLPAGRLGAVLTNLEMGRKIRASGLNYSLC